MKNSKMIVLIVAAFTTMACGNDANSPATLEAQARAVRGSKPTPDQLAAAMKSYKGLAGPPPGSAAKGAGGSPPESGSETAPKK